MHDLFLAIDVTRGPHPFITSFGVGRSYEACVSPDGSSVLTIGRTVVLWESRRKRRMASAHPLGHPSHVDFSPLGNGIIVKSTSGECVVLDGNSLQVTAEIGGAQFGEGSPALFGPGGDVLVEGSWNGDLLVRSTTGRVLLHEREDAMIGELTASPDRERFAYAVCFRGYAETELRLRQWPFDRRQATTIATLGRGITDAIALDAHDRVATLVGATLTVWSTTTGEALATGSVPSGIGRSLAWWPHREVLVVTGADMARGFSADLQDLWTIELPYACSASFSHTGDVMALGSWESGLVGRVA